jgi:deoxyadenosine/deoxycytidine kinase
MIYIFSIEGNIGSGKSTIVKNLKEYVRALYNYEIIYLQEPVDMWESIVDENNVNIIEHFYKDNAKYAFSFQLLAYISRNKIINDIIKNNNNNNIIIITERSIFTDKNVFAKMLYEDKSINEIEYKIYNNWFNEYSDNSLKYNYIYVDTDINMCNERVKKRSRKGENIPLEYLYKCKKFHDEWLNDEDNMLSINGNQNITESIKYNELLNTIIKYIKIIIKTDKNNDQIQGTNITLEDLMNHPFF